MFDLSAFTIQEVTLLVVIVLVVISLICAVISLILETDRSRQWFGDWFQGVSTEMIGAAVTTIFFTFIVGAVEQQQETTELKRMLIDQMGSSVNAEAVRATEALRARGWLRDGTLREQEFYGADLAGTQIFRADLTGAVLFDVNLAGANLEFAVLERANLQAANLMESNLREANLAGAVLEAANLENADLSARDPDARGADLRGANLADANLAGANLSGVLFDETTIRPDAIYNSDTNQYLPNWTPDTDMARFTDPTHPDFWRPQAPYPWWYTDQTDSEAPG